jgi:hypothetical protein
MEPFWRQETNCTSEDMESFSRISISFRDMKAFPGHRELLEGLESFLRTGAMQGTEPP